MTRGTRTRSLPVALVAVLAVAGCFGNPPPQAGDDAPAIPWPPPGAQWDTSGPASRVLDPGPYGVLPAEVHTMTSFDGTPISSAVWRPDVPPGVKVPVILAVSPYYADAATGQDSVDVPAWSNRITFLEGLVPHGFAFGQVSVRGTGASGGCQEFFSLNEQRDIDLIVSHYGSAPWSNGHVALYGMSYEGTTPWMAAAFGNPHLKTIVPVSGVTSAFDHAFRNGTPTVIAPVIHANYWSYGLQPMDRGPADWAENAACPEAARGVAAATAALATGQRDTPPFDAYWQERDFRPRVGEHYRGSVFVVQGWQDWRVPPHMVFPFVNDLAAQGIEVKMLLGQWRHDLPDVRLGVEDLAADPSVRFDYAQLLLHWFRRHLYDDARVDTGPAVETQDHTGRWRIEDAWPPRDPTWTAHHLGDGGLTWTETAPGSALLFSPANAGAAAGLHAPVGGYEATTGPLSEPLRFAGMPQLHATFVPASPEGARVYAQLVDRSPTGTELEVGHAVMDLRYHGGGADRRTLAPNEPVMAMMEFFPLDVAIPAGHELVLRIVGGAGYTEQRAGPTPVNRVTVLDQYVESPTPHPVRLEWGASLSVLRLPLIDRDVPDGTYPGQP